MATSAKYSKVMRMPTPFQFSEPLLMSALGQQSEPAQHLESPYTSTEVEEWEASAQYLELSHISTTVEDSEAPTECLEPSHMSTPIQHPKPLRKSALIQRPKPLRMSSPALLIQTPRITSPTPPAPPPTPHTIHAHASRTRSTSATCKALMASIQASLDRHNVTSPVQYNHASQQLRVRADHTRSVSATLLSHHISTAADTCPPTRTHAPPPLHIRTPSTSSPSLLARPNASASTISLLAGPSAYVYTPLTARAPGFESFRDDHEIESPRRQSVIWRAWKRVRGGT
jgi:hypothetical protein